MCKWARGITGVDLTNDLTCSIDGTINTGSGAAGFMSARYWSSSEADDDKAVGQNFANGNQDGNAKSFPYYVRPVRAF